MLAITGVSFSEFQIKAFRKVANLFTKICGLTRIEDALCAVHHGASAVGFILAKSERRISTEKAAEICAELSGRVKRVGVFVNPDQSDVESVLDRVQLDYLQFHGQEDEAFCRGFNLPYIKAVAVSGVIDMAEIESKYASACAFLLDTYDKTLAGGSGKTFNWDNWPGQSSKPLILAGGLSPKNVFQALKQVKPHGVDVSGGVEQEINPTKGIKDPARIRDFFDQIRSFAEKYE